METEIQILTTLGTEAVQSAIAEYTHWYIIHSICWLCAAIALIMAAVKVWKHREYFDDAPHYPVIGAFILVAFAACMIASYLPTLLSPKAYAIHQLVTDARGR